MFVCGEYTMNSVFYGLVSFGFAFLLGESCKCVRKITKKLAKGADRYDDK